MLLIGEKQSFVNDMKFQKYIKEHTDHLIGSAIDDKYFYNLNKFIEEFNNIYEESFHIFCNNIEDLKSGKSREPELKLKNPTTIKKGWDILSQYVLKNYGKKYKVETNDFELLAETKKETPDTIFYAKKDDYNIYLGLDIPLLSNDEILEGKISECGFNYIIKNVVDYFFKTEISCGFVCYSIRALIQECFENVCLSRLKKNFIEIYFDFDSFVDYIKNKTICPDDLFVAFTEENGIDFDSNDKGFLFLLEIVTRDYKKNRQSTYSPYFAIY